MPFIREGTYAFYPGNWYKLHTTLYGKLWKKLILQTAVLMILSMLYLMDYERIYKTQDLVLATTTGKKMMEKKMLAGTLCGLFYAYPGSNRKSPCRDSLHSAEQ